MAFVNLIDRLYTLVQAIRTDVKTGVYGGSVTPIVPVVVTLANSRILPMSATGTALTTLALTANRMYCVPFVLSKSLAFVNFVLSVTAFVAGTAYVAVYGNTVASGRSRPGNKLFESSGLNVGGSNGDKVSSGTGGTLTAGTVYWLVVTCSSAAKVRAVDVGALASILGRTANATTLISHIYATQAAPMPADASGLSYTAGTGVVPAMYLTAG